MGITHIPLEFHIYACSRNPIVIWTIEHLLSHSSNWRVGTWLPTQLLVVPPGVHILLIDVSSIPEWPEAVRKWADAGHKTILIVNGGWGAGTAELRALHLGVRGIVHITQDLLQRLSEAINLVAQGQLFASGDVLDEFYYGSRRIRPRSATPHLSFREEQVMDLLMKALTNRRIGAVLGISERTAKFHVCNLLRKLQVRTRRELMEKYGNILVQHKSA
ncbi:MAG TPA: LuxR C-terminal-related transcriptional regulator [Candidatus Angelobacter sp.]|jgi:DNA-binding NarL/FixJ family response regulator